jgi:hypothetical protein
MPDPAATGDGHCEIRIHVALQRSEVGIKFSVGSSDLGVCHCKIRMHVASQRREPGVHGVSQSFQIHGDLRNETHVRTGDTKR